MVISGGKITPVRSLQGTEGHGAAAGTAQSPEEDGEGQTGGAGKRRQEGAEGGRLNLLLQAALQARRCLLPTPLLSGVRAGAERRDQYNQPGALDWEPSASEGENGPHAQRGMLGRAGGSSASVLCLFGSTAGGRLQSTDLIWGQKGVCHRFLHFSFAIGGEQWH